MNSEYNFSSQMQFIILCCKGKMTEDNIKTIRENVKSTEHLEEVSILAYDHAVYPLFFHAIMEHASDLVEQEMKDAMDYLFQSIQITNEEMTDELLHITKLFEQQGIEVLSFKGPILAQDIYGNVAFRQYGDLDLLVKEDDIYAAAQLIETQNYKAIETIEFLRNDAKLKKEKNYEFYGSENGMKVEIHWRLVNTSLLKKFKNYDVFSTSDRVIIHEASIGTLDKSILLLYLCNHGASHFWERLSWIVDIDRLIKHHYDSLDWDEVLSLSEQLECRTPLLLGLGLSQTLLNTHLPENLQSQIEKPEISWLVTWVLNTFGTNGHPSIGNKFDFSTFKFRLLLQDSLAAKIKFTVQNLYSYSNEDVMGVNLPSYLFFLYYPLRIIRLFRVYILTTQNKK